MIIYSFFFFFTREKIINILYTYIFYLILPYLSH